MKPGQSWDHAAFFFHEAAEATALWSWGGPTSIKPLHGKGRYTFRRQEGDLAWIDGSFEFFEVRRDLVNNRLKLTVTKNKSGSLSTSAAYDPTRGLIVRGSWVLDVPRMQHRVFQKGEWKVEERHGRESRRIELKEVVRLEADKMAKAVEKKLQKAVDWLKKQQRGSGEWAGARILESDRIETSATGLVVRAVLAAGTKSDDESIQRALRSLRANPGTKTPLTYGWAASATISRYLPGLPWTGHRTEDLRAAFAKNFPKQDLAAVRACADALLELRDRKLGLWAPSKKQGADTPNPITTRHAVEGLFAAHLAGVEIPADVWRGILDGYTGAGVDEIDEVEPEFGYEKGVEELDPNPKKVFPASWRFDSERKPSDDPAQARGAKGFALTTLSVLDLLSMIRASTALSESARKNVDAAIRKGLAWLQWRWTLRTPPPTEAAWSLQKTEYLYLLMRVLTALGVRTVSGSDWYLEGAYLLLRQQYEDGSWDSSGGVPVLDTAYAVLFLTRGALRLPARK